MVTYNSPFYDNIDITNRLYESVFGKVVHCGIEADGGKGKQPDIIADVGNGHRGYVCMARAIEKYPDFQGLFHFLFSWLSIEYSLMTIKIQNLLFLKYQSILVPLLMHLSRQIFKSAIAIVMMLMMMLMMMMMMIMMMMMMVVVLVAVMVVVVVVVVVVVMMMMMTR